MDLNLIRKKLDKLDEDLLKTLAKRMALIPEVAKHKIENNIRRFQPAREKEIINNKRKMAKGLGLNPDLAEDMFKRIIKEAHRIQKKIIGK